MCSKCHQKRVTGVSSRTAYKALQIYASKHFKKDTNNLEILFTELKMPLISKPTHPSQQLVTNSEGVEGAGGNYEDVAPDSTTSGVAVQQQQVDRVDLDIYREELKLYINNKQRLSATCRSLFNVILGQTSRLLTNRKSDRFTLFPSSGYILV